MFDVIWLLVGATTFIFGAGCGLAFAEFNLRWRERYLLGMRLDGSSSDRL